MYGLSAYSYSSFYILFVEDSVTVKRLLKGVTLRVHTVLKQNEGTVTGQHYFFYGRLVSPYLLISVWYNRPIKEISAYGQYTVTLHSL
jgi:hypothetical protein